MFVCFKKVPLWNLAFWLIGTSTGHFVHGRYWRFSDFPSVRKSARRAMSFGCTWAFKYCVSQIYLTLYIIYSNTEDRNTIFNVKLFVFHKFTTNWTSRKQRCVAFSWLSVMELRHSDIHVDTCTFTSQKLVEVITLLPKQTCARLFLPQVLATDTIMFSKLQVKASYLSLSHLTCP